MIASSLWFACESFGWSLEYACWDVPASFLFLMMYQKKFASNSDIMNLQDKEIIDKMR